MKLGKDEGSYKCKLRNTQMENSKAGLDEEGRRIAVDYGNRF